MDISSINRGGSAPAAPAPVVPTEHAAENRDVVQAVKAVNSAELFGQENQLQFQRDKLTDRLVIKVVNRRTHEEVSQIPPESVLRLSEDLKLFNS